jgi:hypothetical protein
MTMLVFRADIAKSTRSGVNCPTPPDITIEVDVSQLPQADRDLLAERITEDGRVLHRGRNVLVVAATPEVSSLLEAIRKEDAAVAAAAAEKEATAANNHNKALAEATGPVETRHKKDRVFFQSDWGISDANYAGNLGNIEYTWEEAYLPSIYSHYLQGEELVARRGRIKVLEEQAKAAKTAAKLEAEESLREQYLEPRLAWIDQHGSQRLKRMVAEGIPCAKTYNQERAAWDGFQLREAIRHHCPGWRPVDKRELQLVSDVSDEAFAILDAARKVMPEAGLAMLDGRYVAAATYEGAQIYWPGA